MLARAGAIPFKQVALWEVQWEEFFSAVAAPGCGLKQLASWWLFEGSEMWATFYSMQSECDFDTQLRAARALQLPDADGVACSPLFFVRADGKAHIMLAGGDSFTKKSPGAMVCRCCGANRETVLRKFGGQEVALEGIKGHVRLTRVFRDTAAKGQNVCVCTCGSLENVKLGLSWG